MWLISAIFKQILSKMRDSFCKVLAEIGDNTDRSVKIIIISAFSGMESVYTFIYIYFFLNNTSENCLKLLCITEIFYRIYLYIYI